MTGLPVEILAMIFVEVAADSLLAVGLRRLVQLRLVCKLWNAAFIPKIWEDIVDINELYPADNESDLEKLQSLFRPVPIKCCVPRFVEKNGDDGERFYGNVEIFNDPDNKCIEKYFITHDFTPAPINTWKNIADGIGFPVKLKSLEDRLSTGTGVFEIKYSNFDENEEIFRQVELIDYEVIILS